MMTSVGTNRARGNWEQPQNQNQTQHKQRPQVKNPRIMDPWVALLVSVQCSSILCFGFLIWVFLIFRYLPLFTWGLITANDMLWCNALFFNTELWGSERMALVLCISKIAFPFFHLGCFSNTFLVFQTFHLDIFLAHLCLATFCLSLFFFFITYLLSFFLVSLRPNMVFTFPWGVTIFAIFLQN